MSLILAAALAAVSSPSPSPSPSTVPQIAHVVTADRSSEAAARTARTTYVVTANDIARDGDRTISDALERVPGVEILSYGAFGAQTSIGIRGSSSQQVLVLLNGLPIAGGQIDGVNLEQLPVSGVERIEVVEGGGSTLYGSGSVGGVVNIITKSQPQSTATVSTGSFGEQTYQFQTPYLSFQRTYAANDYGLPGGTTRQNAYAGVTGLTATYGHRFGNVDASLMGDFSQAIVGVPGPLDFASATSRQNTIDRDLRLELADNGPRSTLSLSLGDSAQDLDYTCDTPVDDSCPNAYPPSPNNPPYSQLLYDTHWMASLKDVSGDQYQRYVYGIDLMRGIARIDQGTSPADQPEIAPLVDAYAQTAAYVQGQWFGKTGGELYAGMRAERDGGVGGAYSPSLGGIVPVGANLQLKLNAATAFRAPTAEDLYYPGFSNPNLQPERTQVGDATLAAPNVLGGVSIGWFTTDGRNLIVDNAAYVPENIGHAIVQGLSLGVATRPLRGYSATFNVTNLYRAQDLDDDTRIYGRGPVFRATGSVKYEAPANARFDGFGVSLMASGGQGAYQPSLPFYAQSNAGYTTLGAFVGVRVAPKLVLTLRGDNLLDDRYAVIYGYPMPGSSFTVELRTR